MSQTIRVKPTHDGTYTVYRGNEVLVSGLTRPQAEHYEASLGLLASQGTEQASARLTA